MVMSSEAAIDNVYSTTEKSDNLKEIGYWLPLFSALGMENVSAKQAPKYSLYFKLPNVTECLRPLLFLKHMAFYSFFFYKKWFATYVQQLMLLATLQSQLLGHLLASKYY